MTRTARMICQTGAAVGAAVLLTAGCRSSSYNQPTGATAAPTVSFGGSAPAVNGSTVTLTLASTGITIKAADGDASGRTGHYVVLVDKDPPAPGRPITTDAEAGGIFHTSDKTLAVRGEEPGSHRFVLVLADGTNARMGDTEATANATVTPPGMRLTVDQSAPACAQGTLVTVLPDGFSLPKATPQPAVLNNLGVAQVPTTQTTLPAAITTTTAPAPSGVTTTTPPAPPTAVTYFLDRLPIAGPTTASDLGTVTAPSLSACFSGLSGGHHSVWAVVVDATEAPLTVPIEGRATFDT